MPSKDIYPFQPTYLYIKRHSVFQNFIKPAREENLHLAEALFDS